MEGEKFRDYIFEKNAIEYHCDEIINTVRLHSDLIFKTQKGNDFKKKIFQNCQSIKHILEVRLDEFWKKDKEYEKFKNMSMCYVFLHDMKKNPDDFPNEDEQVILIYALKIGPRKDIVEQELVTYNKSLNIFKTESSFIDPKVVKLIAWYNTIDYNKIEKPKLYSMFESKRKRMKLGDKNEK